MTTLYCGPTAEIEGALFFKELVLDLRCLYLFGYAKLNPLYIVIAWAMNLSAKKTPRRYSVWRICKLAI